ncbi:hypothetical protein SDRG_10786 [Saprolegnia diclina VS20]|uniref:Zinc finger PHD-type domain-containing protein n=1 Tax=Saprolegnia diclina (strain VS20) TaxID=1156394 RepID=T0QDH4_SAPDV|nr:hypothetical protein SDRG_10786 [Saprolegnia diclina VS20]EQC31620.1 hypothetical protein SDRG_10786 [Saprolegnia diclina VS20]|eukprot:XP_008615019.1 hypothetical protein SDRG_10786 [Saprolegnia diclina VS20]
MAELGTLHKQHARARDVIGAICDRLAAKETALDEAARGMQALRDEMTQRKEEWAMEKANMARALEDMQEEMVGKDRRYTELHREWHAASDQVEALQQTLQEREAYVAKIFAEREASTTMTEDSATKHEAAVQGFSHQETTALEQLEQVRMTSRYLDTYTSDLTKAVNQLSKEVQSLEESQGTCEAMLLAQKNKAATDATPPSARQEMVDGLCDQVGRLQSQNIEYETTVSRLEEALAKAADETATAQTQLLELRVQLGAQAQLVAKYEASSLSGTQAMDSLQSSIALICAEYDAERGALLKQVEELSMASITGEHAKLVEIEEMQAKIMDAENALREKAKHVAELEAALHAKDEMEKRVTQQQQPADEATQRTQAPSAIAPCVSASLASSGALSPALTATSTVAEFPVATQTAAARVPDECPTCHDEPFGFMVRCQQCKQQFHAGCVRSKRQKTSRAGVYVFVCDACAPSASGPATTTSA